jgi:hypothetical protein
MPIFQAPMPGGRFRAVMNRLRSSPFVDFFLAHSSPHLLIPYKVRNQFYQCPSRNRQMGFTRVAIWVDAYATGLPVVSFVRVIATRKVIPIPTTLIRRLWYYWVFLMLEFLGLYFLVASVLYWVNNGHG